MSMTNSNDTFGNRTRDLPACSPVPQPTAPSRDPDEHSTTQILPLHSIPLPCFHREQPFSKYKTSPPPHTTLDLSQLHPSLFSIPYPLLSPRLFYFSYLLRSIHTGSYVIVIEVGFLFRAVLEPKWPLAKDISLAVACCMHSSAAQSSVGKSSWRFLSKGNENPRQALLQHVVVLFSPFLR